jgi:hypothetical protein
MKDMAGSHRLRRRRLPDRGSLFIGSSSNVRHSGRFPFRSAPKLSRSVLFGSGTAETLTFAGPGFYTLRMITLATYSDTRRRRLTGAVRLISCM